MGIRVDIVTAERLVFSETPTLLLSRGLMVKWASCRTMNRS